jgi:hypothetical protein
MPDQESPNKKELLPHSLPFRSNTEVPSSKRAPYRIEGADHTNPENFPVGGCQGAHTAYRKENAHGVFAMRARPIAKIEPTPIPEEAQPAPPTAWAKASL